MSEVGTEQRSLVAFRQYRTRCISGGSNGCDFEAVGSLVDVEEASRTHSNETANHLAFERELVTSTDGGRSLQPDTDRQRGADDVE